MNKKYPLCQSPFYSLRGKQVLADLLQVPSVEKLISLTSDNYYRETEKRGKTYTPPIKTLRRVHDRIQNLLSRIETPSYLHSAVKGRSNLTNAITHKYHHGAVKSDIQNFFPSTPESKIRDFFLVQLCCTRKIAEILSSLLTYQGLLPKGSPCSTTLAFWGNRDMFDEIDNVCRESNSILTVYVDDITISMSGLNKNLLRRTNGIIKRNGYLHHKYRIYKPSQPKVITGVVLQKNKRLVTKSLYKKLRGASMTSNSTRGRLGYIKYIETATADK